MSGGREMAHGEVSEVIPASAAEVFELLHDYGRRLSWDTLLSAAYLDDGFTEGRKGCDQRVRRAPLAREPGAEDRLRLVRSPQGRRSEADRLAPLLRGMGGVHPAHRPVTGRVARHVHLPVHGAPRLAAVGAGANHG